MEEENWRAFASAMAAYLTAHMLSNTFVLKNGRTD